jgi:hypothetical protein
MQSYGATLMRKVNMSTEYDRRSLYRKLGTYILSKEFEQNRALTPQQFHDVKNILKQTVNKFRIRWVSDDMNYNTELIDNAVNDVHQYLISQRFLPPSDEISEDTRLMIGTYVDDLPREWDVVPADPDRPMTVENPLNGFAIAREPPQPTVATETINPLVLAGAGTQPASAGTQNPLISAGAGQQRAGFAPIQPRTQQIRATTLMDGMRPGWNHLI